MTDLREGPIIRCSSYLRGIPHVRDDEAILPKDDQSPALVHVLTKHRPKTENVITQLGRPGMEALLEHDEGIVR